MASVGCSMTTRKKCNGRITLSAAFPNLVMFLAFLSLVSFECSVSYVDAKSLAHIYDAAETTGSYGAWGMHHGAKMGKRIGGKTFGFLSSPIDSIFNRNGVPMPETYPGWNLTITIEDRNDGEFQTYAVEMSNTLVTPNREDPDIVEQSTIRGLRYSDLQYRSKCFETYLSSREEYANIMMPEFPIGTFKFLHTVHVLEDRRRGLETHFNTLLKFNPEFFRNIEWLGSPEDNSPEEAARQVLRKKLLEVMRRKRIARKVERERQATLEQALVIARRMEANNNNAAVVANNPAVVPNAVANNPAVVPNANAAQACNKMEMLRFAFNFLFQEAAPELGILASNLSDIVTFNPETLSITIHDEITWGKCTFAAVLTGTELVLTFYSRIFMFSIGRDVMAPLLKDSFWTFNFFRYAVGIQDAPELNLMQQGLSKILPFGDAVFAHHIGSTFEERRIQILVRGKTVLYKGCEWLKYFYDRACAATQRPGYLNGQRAYLDLEGNYQWEQ